jgi:hypothetical protein
MYVQSQTLAGEVIEMRVEALREVIHAQPFKPFTIVLATGERLLAHHPGFIFAPPGERTAWLVDRDRRTHMIDVGLVVKLELEPSEEVTHG